MNDSVYGVDLSKDVFHFVEMSKGGRVLKKEKFSRAKFAERLVGLSSGAEVYMESCRGAHFWCREALSIGIVARQIAPHRVKPYVGHQKNDYRDAVAICEASQRKEMEFVPTKSSYQQEVEGLHRIRERRVGNRTALMNQMRGLLSEHGVVLPVGKSALCSYFSKLDEDERLSPFFRKTMRHLYEEFRELDKLIVDIERDLDRIAKEDPTIERLKTIPGVGTLTASALACLNGNPHVFKIRSSFINHRGTCNFTRHIKA